MLLVLDRFYTFEAWFPVFDTKEGTCFQVLLVLTDMGPGSRGDGLETRVDTLCGCYMGRFQNCESPISCFSFKCVACIHIHI